MAARCRRISRGSRPELYDFAPIRGSAQFWIASARRFIATLAACRVIVRKRIRARSRFDRQTNDNPQNRTGDATLRTYCAYLRTPAPRSNMRSMDCATCSRRRARTEVGLVSPHHLAKLERPACAAREQIEFAVP